jgi:hypothetical protein
MSPVTSLKSRILPALVGLLVTRAGGQSVVFDFENAGAGSSLPISLTVGGIRADPSSTGLGGFYVQRPQNAALPTPAGFSGNGLIPTGVSAADLHVAFSHPLSDFAILYSPQELGCDASATMRVTAYLNGTLVGTSTTNATAQCTCTWASEWLRFSSSQAFNSVVVHYDAPAPGCQDYGPIFMADDMTVTPVLLPIVLENPAMLGGGAGFWFAFTNWPGSAFTVLAATNPAQPPASWSVLGAPTETSRGYYQFNDSSAINRPAQFYRVSSP